jgi:hypothetical protein
MGKDRALLHFASKLWPVGHRRFEEMCALAVTGQLGGAQMCELDEHISHCGDCRKYLESVAQMSVHVMPLLSEKDASDLRVVPPPGMRDRFLARLAAVPGPGSGPGIRSFRPTATAYPNLWAGKSVNGVVPKEKQASLREAKSVFRFSSWRPIAVVTSCALIAGIAYYAGTRRTAQPTAQVTQVHPVVSSEPPIVATPEAYRVGDLERQKQELETKLAAMKQELDTAQSEREFLHQELDTAKEKLAMLTQQAATNRPTEESHLAKEEVATLQADVSRLNQRLAESEIKLGIQKQQNEDLGSKLALTEADLQREQDLKSTKSEMGELAASRNLHIVDVYDADPNGKRQRSFGRVFYIESQSLVFYAYDLDDPGRFKANIVFHVWGGKAGVKEVTHSLGILRKDDSGQNRWAMTFDDAKVLTQINSVFVTAESASKSYDQPHGKRVLYAYFGSPANHP